jgi:hypothetical protein
MLYGRVDTRSSHGALLTLLALAAAGCDCGTPPVTDDAGPVPDDAPPPSDGGPTECEPRPAFDPGGEGAAEPLAAPAGQSRAGRLEAAELPEDLTGLGVWRAGDFVLAAGEGYALIIEDSGVSDLYDRFGGRPVGIARVEGGRLVEAGDFNEILFGFSTFLTRTESVSVVNDGTDGNAAVVRVIGPLAPIDFAGDVLNVLRGSNRFEGFPSMMEYRMEPGANHVEVSMTIQNPNVGTQSAGKVLMGVFQGNRMPILSPTGGFASLSGLVDYVAFADLDERTSWAIVGPEGGQIRSEIDISGVTVLSVPPDRRPLLGCGETTVALGSIALGTGVSGAQAEAMRVRGDATRVIEGRVLEADGTTPAAGVHVHASVGGAYHTRTTSRADGTYRLEAPLAEASLTAFRRGTAVSDAVVVPTATSNADVRLPPFGTIEVEATEGGEPLPVRVQVLPVGAPVPTAPETYGEESITSGRVHVDFTRDGRSSLRVAPGQYDVIVSRGYEYELFEQRVMVAADGVTTLTAPMRHSVDTTGWMCADYHIHTTRSPDAPDDAEIKVLGMVADGLEIPVRSEHEYAADFQPVVESLGLTRWARGLAGEEITTWVWGHFGAFPMVVDDTLRNGNIPNVYDGALPPDTFAELRARPDDPLLIINHPRSSGPGFGYFSVADYDPVTGMVGRPDHWDEEFTIVEVMNESSFDDNRGADGTVTDWFSFLNRGRRVFAVGSSDSHRIYGVPVGYPRTCLDLGTDDPTALTPAMVRDATEAGAAYVSGGIALEVTAAGGVGPGGTATGVGATTMLRVRVQAAEWIPAEELEVIVDGMTTETIPLTAGADPVLRFDGEVMVPVAAAGSWAIVHVRATDDMERVHPGRVPFAVSNPIFLQR